MKRNFLMYSLMFILVLGLSAVAFADVTIQGTFSGRLDQDYANATYTDVVDAWSALGYLSTTYGATSVNRSFEIRDTYNTTLPALGIPATDPTGVSPDWMQFATTENATGNWVYNDLAYEKKHWQYVPGPGKLTGTSSVDFATGSVRIYNYLAYGGNRDMTHEVGVAGDWMNRVGAATTNGNYSVKMETTANFGTELLRFDGKGAYSPSQADVDAVNNGGMTLAANFNGLVIGLVGNAYQVDHNGTKGAGWYFDVAN